MKCSVCGKEETREGAKVCSACGSPLPTQAEKNGGNAGSLLLKYAALLNNDEGLFKVGVIYKDGIGVEKDEAQAKEIFKYLASRGLPEGMYQLADMCLSGACPDRAEAIRWLTLAADMGHTPSRARLEVILTAEEKAERVAKTAPQKPADTPTAEPKTGEVKFDELVDRAMPYVVTLRVLKLAHDERGREGLAMSAGSGYIVDSYVITNCHVTGEEPIGATARFEQKVDKEEYPLELVAAYPTLDIAILRFADDKAVAKFANRKNLELRVKEAHYGEDVYTIGNPLGKGISVTKGIVSCPNRKEGHVRDLKEVIQVDFTVNHGNSGGALLDMNNNVIGMITYAPECSEGGMTMCVPAKYIVKALNEVNQ